MVTIKDSTELEPFKDAVGRQLAELSITNETVEVGSRKIVTIDSYKIVGFSLRVTGLSPRYSIKLQEEGLGGRRRMGCGIFRRSVQMLAPDRRPIG